MLFFLFSFFEGDQHKQSFLVPELKRPTKGQLNRSYCRKHWFQQGFQTLLIGFSCLQLLSVPLLIPFLPSPHIWTSVFIFNCEANSVSPHFSLSPLLFPLQPPSSRFTSSIFFCNNVVSQRCRSFYPCYDLVLFSPSAFTSSSLILFSLLPWYMVWQRQIGTIALLLRCHLLPCV